jgi:hypothetical protein
VRNRLIERIKSDLDTFHTRQPQLQVGKPATAGDGDE